MSVKFFGQFLIEQGEVDAGHVRQALDLLERTNKHVGEIAVETERMTEAEADRVNQAQRGSDLAFGDLAVKLGVLERQDLVDCLRIQREGRLMMGEALVRLGHLADDRLGEMLDAFKCDQAQYEVGVMAHLPDPLANNRIAPYVLDLLPKFARRIADMTLKVGDPLVLTQSPPFRYRISLPVQGHRGLEITLVGDRAFCARVAAAMAGQPESALDEELLVDGVGEFLNVLCGNAMSALERDGVETTLGVPDHDAELADGWIFDLATSHGRAALVLAQF
ncbi:MAG: chemotaxis protein CheX [Deltaproteobacteria bacterium]|nr:chemotaxis protein CheX [Deltaproteobacteria bacterium]